jgi:hypothetical protein
MSKDSVEDDALQESPKTPAEWQAAVDTAAAFLWLEGARRKGMLTGGPAVNIERCEEILELVRSRGFEPARDAVERFVAELNAS